MKCSPFLTLCKKEPNLSNVERTVKNWKEMPVSEELEQAAVNAFKQIVDSGKNSFLEIFKAGAQWQKECLMKDAVDGEVGYWNIRGLSVNMDLPRTLEEDDKVKLIIIKEH